MALKKSIPASKKGKRNKGERPASPGGTEFGEKPNDYRIELRARYYF